MEYSRALRAVLLALVVAVAVAGCASSSGAGRSTSVPAGLLRGSSVLIACEMPDPAVRGICEEQLADEVEVRGAKPLRLPSDARQPSGSVTQAQLLQSAQTSSAVAVLVLSLAPVAVDEGGSSVSFGIGGFGRSAAGGVGIAAPLGGRVAIGFAGRGTVVEVATGRTVWSGRANAPPSDDLVSQLGGLSVDLLDSADRAGLF